MGLNINVNVQTDWGIGISQGPQKTEGPRGPTFGDNVVSLGGLEINYNYTNDSNNPSLPKPTENASEQVPQKWESAEAPVHEESYFDSFSGNLEEAANQHGLTEEQTNTIVFHQMTGTVPDDTFLSDIMSDIENKVAEEMVETFGEDAFPSLKEQAEAVKTGGQSTVDASQEGLEELQEYAESMPEGPEKEKLQEFINEAKGNLSGIESTLDKLGNASSREEFSDLLSELEDQMEDLEGEFEEQAESVETATDDINYNRVLATLLTDISAKIESSTEEVSEAGKTNQLAQGNWDAINTDTGKSFTTLMNNSFDTSFEKTLSKFATENNLSEEQVAQLRFAHYNPEVVSDPKIKEMLGDIHTTALSTMSAKWGFPPGFIPGSSNIQFNAKIEYANDEAFKTLLQGADLKGLSQQLGMSEADAKGMIEFLHFNKELATEMLSSSSQMKQMLGIEDGKQLKQLLNKLNELEDSSLKKTSKEFGIPAGFIPNVGTATYNATIEGEFLHQFDINLRNQRPLLTNQQIAEVRAALADPLNPNISAETKTLIQNIYSQTIEQVRSQFNLPVGWAPPINQLTALANVPGNVRASWSAVEQSSEQLNLLATFVDAMADNPAKALLINVMKMISEAINLLKERIAQIQVLDSELGQKISQAQSEASLYKIDLQKEKLEEARAKKAKMAPLMTFMKVLGPIIAVLMAPLMMMLGPIGMVIGASMFVEAVGGVKTEDLPLNRMFKFIMENLPSPANILLSAAIVLGMSQFSISAVAGAAQSMTVFFQNSGIIQELVKTAGGNEMAAQLTNSLTEMVVQVVIMVTITILTLGATSGLLAGQISQGIGKAVNTVGNTLVKIAQTVEKFSKPIANLMTKVGKALQAWGKKAEGISKALDNVTKEVKKLKKLKNADKLDNLGQKELQYASDIQAQWMKASKQHMDVASTVYSTLTGASSVFQGITTAVGSGTSFIQADLARINARYDAEIAELEGLIKILKQVLDNIFKGLQAQGTWMAELGNMQNKIWSDLSQTTSMVANANA